MAPCWQEVGRGPNGALCGTLTSWMVAKTCSARLFSGEYLKEEPVKLNLQIPIQANVHRKRQTFGFINSAAGQRASDLQLAATPSFQLPTPDSRQRTKRGKAVRVKVWAEVRWWIEMLLVVPRSLVIRQSSFQQFLPDFCSASKLSFSTNTLPSLCHSSSGAY